MNHKATILLGALALAGCQETLRPGLTPVGQNLTSTTPPIATPIAVPQPGKPQLGSLWVPGSKQFFKDSRAHEVGDIITVTVDETATAKVEAKTDTGRDHTQKAGILGLPWVAGKLAERGIPLGATDLANTTSTRSFKGDGKTDRKDSLSASIAAVVTQVLPNGLLVIQGQREVAVNYEKQVLILQGIVRPEDISSQNTISSAKIAEARIAYAGRGVIDESQTPQYGVRWIDKVLPF